MTYEEFVKIMKLIAYQARIIEEVAPDKFDPLPDEWVWLVTKYADYYQRFLKEDNK